MHVTRFGRVLALQVLLGGAALVLLLARNDLLDALRGLPHLRVGWAAAALLAFTSSKLLQGSRWRFLLRHRPGLPYRWLLGLFLVANFVNAVIPFRLGDVLRVELPSRRFGVPRTELLSNVVIVESLFDGMSFVLLLLASLALIDIPPSLRPALAVGGVTVVALFVLGAGAARGGLRLDGDRTRLLGRLPRRAQARIGDLLAGMATLRSTRDVLLGLGISAAGWLLEVSTYWLLARAFSLDLSFAQTLIVTVAANLATAIPLTPWNVGPYELVVSELLVLLGAERGAVSQYAVGSHVLLVTWISLTGVVAMLSIGLSFGDVRARARELPRPVEAESTSARE